jgi:GrpB-like predicted nucleotidyltransferase (UPF0157 family)
MPVVRRSSKAGLPAKPILDIIVGVGRLRDADRCIPVLRRALLLLPWRGQVTGQALLPQGEPRTHHLHVAQIGRKLWERHLIFRDYLRVHPETALRDKKAQEGYDAHKDHQRPVEDSLAEGVTPPCGQQCSRPRLLAE